jgi:hypothetical protein
MANENSDSRKSAEKIAMFVDMTNINMSVWNALTDDDDNHVVHNWKLLFEHVASRVKTQGNYSISACVYMPISQPAQPWEIGLKKSIEADGFKVFSKRKQVKLQKQIAICRWQRVLPKLLWTE